MLKKLEIEKSSQHEARKEQTWFKQQEGSTTYRIQKTKQSTGSLAKLLLPILLNQVQARTAFIKANFIKINLMKALVECWFGRKKARKLAPLVKTKESS